MFRDHDGPPKCFWREFDYAYADQRKFSFRFLIAIGSRRSRPNGYPRKFVLFSYPELNWHEHWRISPSLRITVASEAHCGARYQKATMKTELVLKTHPGGHVGAMKVMFPVLLEILEGKTWPPSKQMLVFWANPHRWAISNIHACYQTHSTTSPTPLARAMHTRQTQILEY